MKRSLVFVLFALCVLTPYLTTGYYEDDCLNSLLPALLQRQHQTIYQFIWDNILLWILKGSRLYPLGLISTYTIWYWIRDLLLYRIFQVAFVLSNLLLFARVIQALGGGRRLALLSALLVLGLFQLRDFHDPVSSYACILQISFGLGASSVFFLSLFKSSFKRWQLHLSLALFACCLLFYETGLVFIPILAFLALGFPRQTRGARLARWGHLSIAFAYFAAIFAIRILCPAVYAGIQSKLRLKALLTFAYQLSAALPLTYPIFGRSGFFSWETLASREFLSGSAILVLAAGIAVFGYLVGPSSTAAVRPRKNPEALRVFAWSLALVPAALIGISARYQDEVNRIGIGYLPVYLSCFGVALVLGMRLERSQRARACAVGVALLIAFNFSTNRIAAERLNIHWKYPRSLMTGALQHGLLAALPAGSRLVLREGYEWESGDFFALNGVVPPPMIGASDFVQEKNPGDKGPAFYLEIDLTGGGSSDGEIRLSQITGIEAGKRPGDAPRILTAPASKTFRL